MITFDPSDFFNWADKREAQHELPRLIRLLVRATCPETNRIDMPCGSSIGSPGWDGLLTVPSGNAWLPCGHLAIEMSCEQNSGSKANKDYEKRTNDPRGVDVPNTTFIFVTPRRWQGKRQWESDRRRECKWADVRVLDADDLVDWIEQAPDVGKWFAGLIGKSVASRDSVLGLEDHQELHEDSSNRVTQHFDDRFNELKAEFQALNASARAAADPAASEAVTDPAHVELAAKIDSARDSIRRGHVNSARSQLEELRDKHDTMPIELEFRIVTNLGTCALAVEDIDGACALFNQAHRLQPENQKGIANAALAAHLGKDRERAVQLAIKARKLEPQSPQAAAVLLREYWETERIEELENLIDSEAWLAQDQHCGAVVVGIRVEQMRFEEAATICRSLTETDSDDFELQLSLAACLLSWAQADRRAFQYTLDSQALLHEAKVAATNAIERLQDTDLKAQYHGALAKRADAKSLLGEWAEAIHDFDKVLAEDSEHHEAAYNKGLLLVRMGKHKEALPLLKSVWNAGEFPNADLPLADAYIASGDPPAAVKLLKGTITLECPNWMEIDRAEILSQAEKEAGVEDSVERTLNTALERLPTNPMLLALKSTHREIHGDAESAEQSLLKALKHSDSSQHRQIELRLANFYHSQRRYAEAAKLFDGIVNGVASHPLASTLLLCLISSKQLQKALDWAREIKEEFHEPPKLALEVETEVLQFVGDVPAAVSSLMEICSRSDATTADQVRLASAQFRNSEHEMALKTALGINPADLCQDPQSLLKLAQLKLLLGATGYLDDAYLALRCAKDDPNVHLAYIGLFQGSERTLAEPETVGPGCAVLLQNESTRQWWYILEDGEATLGPYDVPQTHELAQDLKGRRTGETVVLRQGLEDLSYKIADVQSKFVRAFQETIAEFSTRFPGNENLSRIEIKGDDFTKVFLSLDQHSVYVRKAIEIYRDGQLPFVTLCSLLGKSVLEVWRGFTEDDSTTLHTGTGTDKEAAEASALLREADSVVLDLVALLTVHRLGLADHLRTRFSQVAVPQHVFDEIQNIANMTRFWGPHVGYMGKSVDGRYTLAEVSEDMWTEWQDYVASVLDLCESFKLIPTYKALDTNDIESHVDALTPAGASAVYAGKEKAVGNSVLISDDLGLSSVARWLGIGVVNTQAVLQELLDSNMVSDEEYSAWIEQLVSMNYRFIRVAQEDILRRLKANGYVTTVGTRKMIKMLEGPDCPLESAVIVASAVIAELSGKTQPSQVGLITMAFLESLRQGRDSAVALLAFRHALGTMLDPRSLRNHDVFSIVDTYIQLFDEPITKR